MNLADLVQTAGYPIVALGAFLEGESVVLAAGIAARLGYLQLLPVIVLALVFSFAGDQLVFHAGRRWGPAIVARWPTLAAGLQRVDALIAAHPDKIVIGIRFMYGLRFAGLLALGMSPAIRARRFLLLNLFGALLWSVSITLVGYAAGEAVRYFLADIKEYHPTIVVVVALLAALWWFAARARRLRDASHRRDGTV